MSLISALATHKRLRTRRCGIVRNPAWLGLQGEMQDPTISRPSHQPRTARVPGRLLKSCVCQTFDQDILTSRTASHFLHSRAFSCQSTKAMEPHCLITALHPLCRPRALPRHCLCLLSTYIASFRTLSYGLVYRVATCPRLSQWSTEHRHLVVPLQRALSHHMSTPLPLNGHIPGTQT